MIKDKKNNKAILMIISNQLLKTKLYNNQNFNL